MNTDPADTILVVDDEESVRTTFREWLVSADLDCRILVASDAESALVQADQNTIDLAILDWNLGAGADGLHLLADLCLFNPEVVAILVTGYAHQATPLDAMRMGVRDYLDKNQDLNRESFLEAVRKQLSRIRPAKRERRLHQSLMAFREAIEKILPLVNSAAMLNDPVPLPKAIRSLFRFLLHAASAGDGVLLARSYDADRTPAELCRAYSADGTPLDVLLVPFAHSVAGTAVSMQEPCILNSLDESAKGLTWQPFEHRRRSLLAAPLAIAPGIHIVFELFDKQSADGFTPDDARLVKVAAEFAADVFRQALAERHAHNLLFEAVAAALKASETVTLTLQGSAAERLQTPPPEAVLERLRAGLKTATGEPRLADATVRLAEAVRVLGLRHGARAIEHCTALVESLRRLLDTATGAGEHRERESGADAD
jgi:two-component system, NtrC family, nitrogen regulation response regulator NtrX